jgi:putative transposase
MEMQEKLKTGKFYHIYNHGVGERILFLNDDNYQYFLSLYDKYISPIADTWCWCLMPNHFHLLVRIKENLVYRFSGKDKLDLGLKFDDLKWQTVERTPELKKLEESVSIERKVPNPSLHFSHLLNAYSRYFNNYHEANGALFERPFNRKCIDSAGYLKQAILYIHNNPVYHGFCQQPEEYPWSSYCSFISSKKTKLKREEVLKWFSTLEIFEEHHNRETEKRELDDKFWI